MLESYLKNVDDIKQILIVENQKNGWNMLITSPLNAWLTFCNHLFWLQSNWKAIKNQPPIMFICGSVN